MWTFFQALEAVNNATKATTLIILGSDREPIKATFAAFFLAVAAGIGEEALFRGCLQDSLVGVLGNQGAIFVAAAIFGVLHAVTPTYAVLATVAGLYFGWLFKMCGSNIAIPAFAHTLYDWIALVSVHLEVTKPPKGSDGSQKSLSLMQKDILRSQQHRYQTAQSKAHRI